MLSKLARFLLFGNYYLAFCIVALSFETAFKNGFQITDAIFYWLLFLAVVVYYTHAYIGDYASSSNPRTAWYAANRKLIFFTQLFFTILIALGCVYQLVNYGSAIAHFSIQNWLLLLLFPFLALLYYDVIFPARFRFKLRNIAWLKPFIIGFVCTGMIVVYPLLFYSLQTGQTFHFSFAEGCYFFTNWMFTTAIALMFDIKDFAADHNYQLKTFVVTKGLRRTLFFILLPLILVSFVSFVFFALLKQFSLLRIFINTLPFFLMSIAAASLRRRKSILYYLIIIDGLLLVKALFGIAAMVLAK
ncbi:MAG: hypothetical protein M3R72_09285 [Bacteroidota bacterium]|nr:hypothetical protein [Bacteroidota bacterium]